MASHPTHDPRRREPRPAAPRRFDTGESPAENLEVYVAGIECAMCARRLAAHLRALPGVERAVAHHSTGTLRVRFLPAEISRANLFVEVRRAGFVPAGERLLLRVRGMHCRSCARAIERALLAVRGVERVSASHESGEVHVDVLPGQNDVDRLTEAVTRLGYGVDAQEESR